MEISFPDSPPVDPMDGDYLYFAALVDGEPVKCCVAFVALTPRSNNPESVKLVYWKKKDQLRTIAKAMIEAGEVRDREILITSLTKVPSHVEFPDIAPTVNLERKALAFPAVASGDSVICIVSFEVLIGPDANDSDEAVRVYQTQKAELHEKARMLIAAGKVDADGELWVTGLV